VSCDTTCCCEPSAHFCAMQVATAFGPVIARPGDWIVLSHNGQYHVARASNAWDA